MPSADLVQLLQVEIQLWWTRCYTCTCRVLSVCIKFASTMSTQKKEVEEGCPYGITGEKTQNESSTRR
jgi:hypothetical protein